MSSALVMVDGFSLLSAPVAKERVAEYPHPTPIRAKRVMVLTGGACVNWTHQLVCEAVDTMVPPAGSDLKLGCFCRAWVRGMAVELGTVGDPAAENPDRVVGVVVGWGLTTPPPEGCARLHGHQGRAGRQRQAHTNPSVTIHGPTFPSSAEYRSCSEHGSRELVLRNRPP